MAPPLTAATTSPLRRVQRPGHVPWTKVRNGSDYYDDTDCSTRRSVLLAFCPLDVVVNLGVQRLFDLIAYTLSRYNKPYEAVNFMVTDNHSVNQYVGSREGALLMVDCASHRFHLAGSDYLTGYETLLTRIHALMTKLRNIKDRAILRRVTELSSLLRNGTRWSSTHAMAQRYTKLGLALKELK